MIPAVAKDEVTLREWWQQDAAEWTAPGRRPVSYWTVVQRRRVDPTFPEAVRVVPPNTHLYSRRECRAWLNRIRKESPDLFRGRPA